MSQTKTRRIGPSMKWACWILQNHFGNRCRGLWNLGKAVGPHGSVKYGCEIVHRAMAAGLITGTQDKAGVWTIWLTEKGEKVANEYFGD